MTESEWLVCDDPAVMLDYLLRRNHETGNVAGERMGFLTSERKLRLFACACCRQVWDGEACPRCNGKGVWPDPDGGYFVAKCSPCRGTGRVGGLTNVRGRRTVQVAERYADGLATKEELARVKAWAWCDPDAAVAALAVVNLLNSIPPARMAALLRDIVGNPFRRVTLPLSVSRCSWCGETKPCSSLDCPWVPGKCPWLTWNDGMILKLARFIYDGRRFDLMPTLGDALEDAGCPAEEVCGRCGGKGGRMLNSTDAVRSAPGECPVCGLSGRVPNQLLEHLRGPGPHALGCWALDLCAWAAHAPEEID